MKLFGSFCTCVVILSMLFLSSNNVSIIFQAFHELKTTEMREFWGMTYGSILIIGLLNLLPWDRENKLRVKRKRMRYEEAVKQAGERGSL